MQLTNAVFSLNNGCRFSGVSLGDVGGGALLEVGGGGPPDYLVVLEGRETDPGGGVGFVVEGGEDEFGVRGKVED